MKCEYCGNEIDDNSKFCRYCGKEQAPIKLCIKCGKELGLEDKWCRYCGAEQSKSDVAESFDTPNIGRLSDDENQVINDAIKGVDKRKNLFGKKSLIAIDITFIIVAIVQHDMNLKRSTYEVLQILSISLTDKTHLHDLFDKTNFNDVKDLNDPLIPGLFD